ncbi:transcription factor bHLH126-like [Chenopodium quinoa]|uniref:transcription factor bHLH126-like n=1 Tax=Chenopodium quinoa TaxID=63459 RepID=UPI000B773D5F|nr:transcription factor bHLH126-like [Chenopodium quinoa]
MFPFQSGELSFQISNDLENNNNNNNITTNTNTNFLFEHHISSTNAAVAAGTTTTNIDPVHQPHYGVDSKLKSPKTRKLRSGKSVQDNKINNEDEIKGNDITNKKVIHREVERQRRQEMSNLYSSLRSLLPVEYVKGKRSVSEHITEATRYIKDLEKNVKELGEKRDSLKDTFSSLENRRNNKRENNNVGCSSSSSTTSTTSRSSSSCSTRDYNVNIHKFSKTLQIEITAGVEEDDPCPISKTLKVLAQEGLDVVSCVSNKVNQRWIYVIYCEVTEETAVDSCHLREKLMSVVVSSSDV